MFASVSGSMMIRYEFDSSISPRSTSQVINLLKALKMKRGLEKFFSDEFASLCRELVFFLFFFVFVKYGLAYDALELSRSGTLLCKDAVIVEKLT